MSDAAGNRAEPKKELARDRIHIADEVISAIAVLAVGKIRYAAASSAGVGEGLAGLLGMRSASKGVKIESSDSGVSVDLYVTVEYGQKLNEVAKALQEAVRRDIEEMTGLPVAHANVHVLGIYFREQKDAGGAKDARDGKEIGGASDGKEIGQIRGGGAQGGQKQLGEASGQAAGEAKSDAGGANGQAAGEAKSDAGEAGGRAAGGQGGAGGQPDGGGQGVPSGQPGTV
ncbi:MAG: Asp23/Gls24 family envelope stress response protein [Clostridiales bacterium]|jgi:uncharacterized alkaline shock family protein YloU|nr:Asp23/Gls24 family envelope stress response protein [Clostridiales bacterium]